LDFIDRLRNKLNVPGCERCRQRQIHPALA
jgi:hypothetical protein